MSNLLLFRGSPRSNIGEVEQYNKSLPCDKLIIRYEQENKAYEYARQWFLKHREYTHFVLATDDIVVQPEHIDQLAKDIELFNLPVVCGMMNVDQDEYMKPEGKLNISYELPYDQRGALPYVWITRQHIPQLPIFQVDFNGFALMCIRRDVMEKITVSMDNVITDVPTPFSASLDFHFCLQLKKLKIPIMVDRLIDLKHLRSSGIMQVTQRTPEVEFIIRCEREGVDLNWLGHIVQEEITKNDMVLDLGCGIMQATGGLKCKSILGCDVFISYLSHICPKVMTVQLSMDELNRFANESYDVVICLDVVEHLDKELALKVLKEMQRICRKKAIIYTPKEFINNKQAIDNSWDLGSNPLQEHKCVIEKQILTDLSYDVIEPQLGGFLGVYKK